MPVVIYQAGTALLALVFAFNMTLSTMARTVTVTGTEYGKDYIVYHLKAKEGDKTTPVKVVYHRPNKVKISYRKDGNNVDFSYEHEGNNPLSRHDQELVQQIKNEMLKHSNTWMGRSKGKLRDLLIDFRDTLMRKPVRR